MTREELLLLRLMEECAEVQQRTSKQLNFGPNERQPTVPNAETNVERLRFEILDVMAVVHILMEEGIIPVITHEEILTRKVVKRARIEHYLTYSKSLGLVADGSQRD